MSKYVDSQGHPIVPVTIVDTAGNPGVTTTGTTGVAQVNLFSNLAGEDFSKSATGRMLVAIEDASNPAQVSTVNAAGSLQVNVEGLRATYSASVTGFTPVATPTDFFNIFGSTSIVRITRIELSAITTSATPSYLDLQVIKRSTAGTLGSAVLSAVTAAPHDANNAAVTAVASTVGTANYTTLGTIVGTPLRSIKIMPGFQPLTATEFPIVPQPYVIDFTNRNEQGIILRTATQQLALGLNGGTLPAGFALNMSITWTEGA